MRPRKSRPVFSLVLAVFLFAAASSAMNMPHYDVDSLVYMSTDIVISSISENADHKFTATVTDTLYGLLRPGDRLTTLTPFLTFFKPMKDDMRVVLFLNRHPHIHDFFNPAASKSPFAVPPSGVYLIDIYGHVHEYYQEYNPGPYVAKYYSYCGRQSVPTKAQDLSLPSLDEIEKRIATAVKAVRPVRHVLDKVAVRADAPALLRLADRTSNSKRDCGVRMAQAITERAVHQIQSLHDPKLLLRVLAVSDFEDYDPFEFVHPEVTSSKEFFDARVRFLVRMFSNHREPLALRIAAVRILLSVPGFNSELQAGWPYSWVEGYVPEIQDSSKKIFNDASESPRLRALCLRFLSLNNPKTLTDVRRVYRLTTSQQLRFAIEVDFLKVSDALYESLDPPGGPVASIIGLARENGCEKETYGSEIFLAKFKERKDFRYSPGANSTGVAFPRPALMNLRTGRHLELLDIRQLPNWWVGARQGEFEFQVQSLSGIPPGHYSLALEFAHNHKILSLGYGLKVSIRKTPGGKELSVVNPAQDRLDWFFQ